MRQSMTMIMMTWTMHSKDLSFSTEISHVESDPITIGIGTSMIAEEQKIRKRLSWTTQPHHLATIGPESENTHRPSIHIHNTTPSQQACPELPLPSQQTDESNSTGWAFWISMGRNCKSESRAAGMYPPNYQAKIYSRLWKFMATGYRLRTMAMLLLFFYVPLMGDNDLIKQMTHDSM